MNPQTRRHFLAATSAFAFAVGCQRFRGQFDPATLDRIAPKLKGRLILPNDPAYETARRVFYWNSATERSPRAIVQCASEDDVARAVEFARARQLEIAIRAGGHSHLGWGTSDGIVIDLSAMKRVTVDPVSRTARAEGGALSGEIARESGRHGLAPVLGQCPGVGASGVTLGGGLGWLSGLHGASCDNLLSARIVTADARPLAADANQNPDLLWALRGAGANFGVATSLEYQLHPIGPITGGDIHYSIRDARAVLRAFRELMDNSPDAFQATLNLTPGERGVFISLCHAGSEAEANDTLRQLRAIATPTRELIKRQPFAELAERPAATNPANTAPPKFRGIQAVYRERLDDELIDIIADRLQRAIPAAIMGISHYMHGKVCRVSPTATAFALRAAGAFNIRLAYTWNDDSTGATLHNWANQSLQLLRPKSNERIYANFQTYNAPTGARAVYSDNHARLTTLKHKHDPANLFRRNSNIAPRSAA